MVLPHQILVAAYALGLNMLSQPTVDFKPVDVATGHDTQIEQRRAQLVSSQPEWLAFWQEHKGARNLGGNGGLIQSVEPAPALDFKRNMVIAFFAGPTSGIAGFEVVDSTAKGREATVQIIPIRLPGGGADVLTTPYVLVVVPRIKMPVALYLGSGSGKNPSWKLLSTFSAISD